MNDLEILHWFSSIYFAVSMVASVLVNVFPPPEEIASPKYRIFYKTMERLSVHRPAWKNGKNGASNANGQSKSS